jgi:hypothetical protein
MDATVTANQKKDITAESKITGDLSSDEKVNTKAEKSL